MSLWISTVLFFIYFDVNVAAAANSNTKNIRYEKINPAGDLVDLKFITDPLVKKYKKKYLFNKKISQYNRINIVFVGDGYTLTEQEKYKSDVENLIQNILAEEPFKTYKNYLSFKIINSISTDSGIKNSLEDTKNTALGMYYNCAGIERLLCIDLEKLDEVTSSVEAYDIIFALANSEQYGGAGYINESVATLAAQNKASTNLALHEFGHSFADLSDEYEAEGIDVNCNSFVNSSNKDSHALINDKEKWYYWLDLPHIGTFKGSCYSQSFYRPTLNSKMRSLKYTFAEVNTEQIIKKIYQRVKPIDQVNVQSGEDGNLLIKVNLLQPLQNSLTIDWAVNDKTFIAWNNKTQIDTKDLLLSSGTHKLTATVTDKTHLVRDEVYRNKKMTQTWNINFEIRENNLPEK